MWVLTKNIEFIAEVLDEDELLGQLAEECTELAKAALKLRRARTQVNPTPVAIKQADLAITEEIADVWLVLSVLGRNQASWATMLFKSERWCERLKGRGK